MPVASPARQVPPLTERLGIETEFFFCDGCNELRARLVIRLVKHARPGPLAELLGIGLCQKRALVMVEPPGHFRRIRKLEIHNHVFVAIEQLGLPWLRCPVSHPGKAELRVRVKAFAIKAVKECGGSSAIKAAIVETEPNLDHR